MRQNQSQKILKKIEASVQKKFNLKAFKNIVSNLTKEIQLFKKFSERKSMRHTGKYKEDMLYNNGSGKTPKNNKAIGNDQCYNDSQKQNDDSVYDWIVDIDYITHVLVSPNFSKKKSLIFI